MPDTQTATAVDTLLTWKPLRACLRLWPQSLAQRLALDGALAISVPGERGRRQAGRRAQQLCPQEAHCTANRGQTTSTQRARAHSKVRTQGGGPPWPGRQHQPGEVIPGLTGWVRKGSPEGEGGFQQQRCVHRGTELATPAEKEERASGIRLNRLPVATAGVASKSRRGSRKSKLCSRLEVDLFLTCFYS